jgi:adenosine deaminase
VATVNSDDPAYFGGYINDNFVQTFAATSLNVQHACALARNSFDASFVDEAGKRGFHDRLERVLQTFE